MGAAAAAVAVAEAPIFITIKTVIRWMGKTCMSPNTC